MNELDLFVELENPKLVHGVDTEIYIFHCVPMGAPRITRSDKWKLRDVVVRYHALRDEIRGQARRMGFVMPSNNFHIRFYIEVPKSKNGKKYSKIDRENLIGKPAISKPDIDNLFKAFTDALFWKGDSQEKDIGGDEFIYDCRMSKYYCKKEDQRIEVEIY